MTYSTSNVLVTEQDGWVNVATAPTAVIVKAPVHRPWFVAVSASTPAAGVTGLPYGQNRGDKALEEFRLDAAISENVYVRIPNNPDSRDMGDVQGMNFAVVIDDGM